MALVDGFSPVEVLAHDLSEERLASHGGILLMAGLSSLLLDAHGTGLRLDLVHFAESFCVRAES